MAKLIHSIRVDDEFYVLDDIVEIKARKPAGIVTYMGRIKRFIYGGTNDCVVLDVSTRFREDEEIIDIDSISSVRRIDIND